jgi:glutamyl-tRNA reductase
MRFAVVGLNHKTTSLELREKLAFSETQINEALLALKRTADGDGAQDNSFIDECVILSTCNRTEFYCVYNCDIFNPTAVGRFIAERHGVAFEEVEPHLYHHEGADAVEHLFRVGAGLESMVLGEHQIAGQIKKAYYQAVACQTNGVFINKVFHAAFHVSKRVRSETKIGVGSTSVSQIACDFAKRLFGDLSTKSALIIGAGESSELAARHFLDRGIGSLVITNRTFKRAQELAKEIDAQVAVWESLPETLAKVDIVVSATSAPNYILTADMVRKAAAGRTEPLFLIDIAVPRDIMPEVSGIDNVVLSNLDDLQKHIGTNMERRHAEKIKADRLIEEAKREFVEWHHQQMMTPTIAELRQQAEKVRSGELRKLQDSLSSEDFAKVDAMTRSMMNKLLHNPIITLKQAASKGIDMKAVEDMVRVLMGIGA